MHELRDFRRGGDIAVVPVASFWNIAVSIVLVCKFRPARLPAFAAHGHLEGEI
jgi:hypothetical protein